MILTNKTRKTILAKDLKETKSISDKFLGLWKNNNPKSLLFKTRLGIHTFFLKEPIDVIVLSNELKIVKTATVKPNSIFIYNPKFLLIVELPHRTVAKTRTKVGDRLAFEPDL